MKLENIKIFVALAIIILLFIIFEEKCIADEKYYQIACKEDHWVGLINKSKSGIVASSTLPQEGSIDYSPENLFDKNIKTCWATKGDGIGEFIIMKIPFGVKGIKILNGLAASRDLFYANNRVKKIYLGLIIENPREFQNDVYNVCGKTAYTKENITVPETLIEIKDNDKYQEIIFSKLFVSTGDKLNLWKNEPNNYIIKSKEFYLIIGVADIYKGSKYNDTCISEIEIIP